MSHVASERFSARGSGVIRRAEDIARSLAQAEVTPGHLLLGLVEDGDEIAAPTLRTLGVDFGQLRDRVTESAAHTVGESRDEPLPCSSDAEKCLELAGREALQLGERVIEPEHILLGVVRFQEGISEMLGIPLNYIRPRVLRLKGKPVEPRERPSDPDDRPGP